MRIHRLEVNAFGPFGGSETIDFDDLNEAGLFLLTGPTGAGKTSILDAICFALFGAVPGARNNAKDLKSHHADNLAVPVVELEVTLRERRFRLRRSPAWRRSSSRAKAGYVDENAKATMAEIVDGEWAPLGNRLDEIGLLVTRMLGMNRDQFCQVVMLPQGQFQTFLRAGAKDRRDVLEALFETSRFGRIEKWLGDHRRRCDKAVADHEVALQQLLERVCEVHGGPLLDESQECERAADLVERSRAALRDVLPRLEAALDEARQLEGEALVAAKSSQHACDQAEALGDQQRAHAAAVLRKQELDALADVALRRGSVVEKARQARVLRDLVDLYEVATTRLSAVSTSARQCFDSCRAPGPVGESFEGLTARAVDAAVKQHRDNVVRVSGLAEVAERLANTEQVVTQADATRDELLHERTRLVAELTELPATMDRTKAELASAMHATSELAVLSERVSAATLAHQSATRATDLAASLSRATEDAQGYRVAHLLAREHWLDIRERYLGNLAAVLAAELADDAACPVCGSREHPSPADAVDRQASAADEAHALAAVTQAGEAAESSRTRVSQLEQDLAVMLTMSHGVPAQEALARLAAATQAETGAAAIAASRPGLEEAIAELSEGYSTRRERQADLDARLAAVAGRRADAAETVRQLRARLDLELPEGVRVVDHVDKTNADAEAWEVLAEQMRDVVEARHRVQDLGQRLETALGETSFRDVEAVRHALLPDADVARLAALNRSYESELEMAARLVSDPHLAAAAEHAAPDLDALGRRAEVSAASHRLLSAEPLRLARQVERLDELSQEIDVACQAGTQLYEARDLAVSVAGLCAGTSPDNRSRTTLSHYVLGARLKQVVDAANVRLSGIAGGRYQLEHSMERGVGDARGGLGLLVLDTHTGSSRDPATLSGGETFYVSLALALGLADLVRDEVGGPELSTLFVDEGFGGLDAETLDEVMDEIDTLRVGGRCVGLVSHLSELRLRVPTQVQVSASPCGSHVLAR